MKFTHNIGPAFDSECRAAGLGGLAFSWTSTGVETEDTAFPADKVATLQAVIAAHNPATPAPLTQDQQDVAAAKAYAKLAALRAMTPTQVQAWVSANVTNLAQAQDAITTLAIAVSILARRL